MKGLKAVCQSFVASLKACAKKKDLHQGTRLHVHILKTGLIEENAFVGNTLVSMYAQCDALAEARRVLDWLPNRDAVSWNALIAGYAQKGQGKEALNSYRRMLSEGLSPDEVTYCCILKACGLTQEVDTGEQIHDEIVSRGLLGKAQVLGNALIDMYAKFGMLSKSQEVLNELPVRDVVSWSSLISGYAQQGQVEEALECIQRMQSEGLSPNAVTYACILKVCGVKGAVDRGQQIHDEIVSQGLLSQLGTALVDMYVKCGALSKARGIIDDLPARDIVSWNALIAGYAQQGRIEEALHCLQQMRHEGHTPDIFSWNAIIGGYAHEKQIEKAMDCYQQMQHEGISPNAISFASLLKACGLSRAINRGKQIHDEIVSQGLLGNDVVIGTALVDMYAKCGVMTKAQQVLDELPVRNLVSWSALMAGYAQKGQGREALICYEQMLKEGLSPNVFTYACILKACGMIGDVDRGKKIHDEIVRQGLLGKDVVLGNALVDMYSKCGVLREAQHVLDELSIRDVVSWSALIAGYAQQGQVEEAFDCFQRMQSQGLMSDIVSWNALIAGYAQKGQAERVLACFQWMQDEGIPPNAVTFLCVLNACSHSGLVEEGRLHYEAMSGYGITPNTEHHTCMVDLYGRAGHFDKAMTVIKKMPSSDYPLVWSALLGACQRWKNVKLGRLAFEHAIQLDENCSAAYVCMANIYVAAGMQEDARKIEAMRMKKFGRSPNGLMDVNGDAHISIVGG